MLTRLYYFQPPIGLSLAVLVCCNVISTCSKRFPSSYHSKSNAIYHYRAAQNVQRMKHKCNANTFHCEKRLCSSANQCNTLLQPDWTHSINTVKDLPLPVPVCAAIKGKSASKCWAWTWLKCVTLRTFLTGPQLLLWKLLGNCCELEPWPYSLLNFSSVASHRSVHLLLPFNFPFSLSLSLVFHLFCSFPRRATNHSALYRTRRRWTMMANIWPAGRRTRSSRTAQSRTSGDWWCIVSRAFR